MGLRIRVLRLQKPYPPAAGFVGISPIWCEQPWVPDERAHRSYGRVGFIHWASLSLVKTSLSGWNAIHANQNAETPLSKRPDLSMIFALRSAG